MSPVVPRDDVEDGKPRAVVPYCDSVAVGRLREIHERGDRPRIAFLDIDSTLTGPFDVAGQVRDRLESSGYVVVFVTSRTEEMILRSDAYCAAQRHGDLRRPPPRLMVVDGRREYGPPEDVEPTGVLDGDIIAGSTGTRILVRQVGGNYLPDNEYEARYGLPSDAWRAATLQVLTRAMQGIPGIELAQIENPDLYHRGDSDVFPPDYRVQVNAKSVDDKMLFLSRMRALYRPGHCVSMRIIDDSKPESGGYKLFVTPRTGSKVRAVERIVDMLCASTGLRRSTLELFFAGDSFPDLAMGLYGGLGAPGTLLLAGGSRLVRALVGELDEGFAGERLTAVRRRLSPTDRRGVLSFRTPGVAVSHRRVVIGDETFPGTEAVETVYRYLEQETM